MTHLRSLRDYITALDEIGEIQRVDTEVDWNLEIGAVIRRSYDLRAPAPLFTNISGYDGSGFRVLGAPAALSGPAHPLARIALSLGLPATGPPVEEDHTVTGTMHAAEILYSLRRVGLPAALAWVCAESAFHWLIVAVRSDWPETFDGHSGDLARRIGEIAFTGKAGFGVPKILVVEDDIDITSVDQVVWAFATRAHPEHGEVRFSGEPTQVAGEVYLDEAERHSYQAGKVVYNCLLADRFAQEDRPVKGDLEHGWPASVRQRVLDKWHDYGYR